jgi:hypothetical protein
VIALGRLGWPLRRIEQETGVRRETAGAYLKAAGIAVRPPGAWGRRPPAKPANENEVTTGSDAAKPASTVNLNPNPDPENLSSKGKAKATSKPANAVTTGFGVESTGLEVENLKRIRSASACRLAAAAQHHHEQSGASIFSGLRITDHCARTVVHLRLFSWSRQNHRAWLQWLVSAQLAHVALDDHAQNQWHARGDPKALVQWLLILPR